MCCVYMQKNNSVSSLVAIECMICVQVGRDERQQDDRIELGMSGSTHNEVSIYCSHIYNILNVCLNYFNSL
jgi:hypothetical protein